jgi:DNA polymerase-3 subunit epsilon
MRGASTVFKNIVLTQPLAIIDLETTGTDAKEARSVEISVLKILPDGTNTLGTRRITPGIPIPPGTTAVHGITDADVAEMPPQRNRRPSRAKLAYTQESAVPEELRVLLERRS